MAVAEVGKRDFIWTLLATIFKMGSGVLLYPLILRMLPTEVVGIWTIFTSVMVVASLLDFGFEPSFSRNVSYIFSGVRQLHKTGFDRVGEVAADDDVDYALLGNTIRAMRFFYTRMSLVLFLLLSVAGTFYIYTVVRQYDGNKTEIYVSWAVLCAISCYNLFTQYYNSLLRGRGLVMRSNQIIICGNVAYLVCAVCFVLLHGGLLSVVSAQAVSVLVSRTLSHRVFFTKELRIRLAEAERGDLHIVLSAITPNAVKMGLTQLGSFFINRSSTFIGSLYVPLADMASYGITLQLAFLVASVSKIVTTVFNPKVFQWRVENNIAAIRRTFYISSFVLFSVFLVAGLAMGLFGNWVLALLGSKTTILTGFSLFILLLQFALDSNHSNAANFLMSKNEIPFFKASLVAAGVTLALLLVFVVWLRMGVVGMVLAPFLAQLVYQNWKWPVEVIKELGRV